MTDTTVIPKGQTFSLSFGVFDDYTSWVTLVALKDIDTERLIKRFKLERGNMSEKVDPWVFANWVKSHTDLVEVVPLLEWNFGSHGTFDHEGVRKKQ